MPIWALFILGEFVFTLFIPTEREALTIFDNIKIIQEHGVKCFYYKNRKVIITGMGKVNCAISTMEYIHNNPEDDNIFLLMGIAGAYRNSGVILGEAGFIQDDYYVDEAKFTGVSLTNTLELGKVTFYVPDLGYNTYISNTVSLLPANDELAEIYKAHKNAQLENMEGAAFGQVAAKHNKRIAQFRAVSNFAGKTPEWTIKKAINQIKSFINLLDRMEFL